MISATLFMDVSGAIRSLNEFGSKLQGLSNLSSVFRGLNEAMSTLTEGIAGQFQKVHAAMNLGAEMEELSAATGQSVRDLMVLRKAFSLAGIASEEVAPMIARLQKALGGTNEMGEPTAKVFERIGLSVEKLKAQSAIQQLRSLQEAFAKIENPADRTKAAMDIFGKTGFKMLPLIAKPQTVDTAEKKAGGFGREMEEMAPTLKSMSTAVGELGKKWTQFYANVLNQIAPHLEKFVKMLNSADFSAMGKSVGMAASKIGDLAVTIAQHTKPAAIAIGSLILAFGPLRNIVPGSIRAIRTGLDSLGVACIRNGGMVGALRVGWVAAFRAMAVATSAACAAMAAALKALGRTVLVGFLIEAGVWGAGKAFDAASAKWNAKVNNKTASSVNAETARNAQEWGEKFQKLSSEDARDGYREQLENDRKLAEQEAETAAQANNPQTAAAFRSRVEVCEQLLAELKQIPKEVIAQNAELKRGEIAAKETEKAVEELRKSVAKLGDEYDKLRAKNALEALPLDERRDTILKSFGPDMSERALERGIELRQGTTDPAEVATLEKLLEAYKEILEINKKRMDAAEKATESETQHEEKIQQLDAELAGNEALLRDLKDEKKLRERIAQLRAAGVQNPEQEAHEEIGKERKAEDKKRDEKTLDWKKKFALDMKKLDAQIRGDKRAERQAEREEKIEQYTKEGVAAHLPPDVARAAAVAKADKEFAAKDAEDAKKSSIFADTDRRIGLGGIAVQTRADPLIKAHQESARVITILNGKIDTLNGHLAKQPNTIMKPLVPLFQ